MHPLNTPYWIQSMMEITDKNWSIQLELREQYLYLANAHEVATRTQNQNTSIAHALCAHGMLWISQKAFKRLFQKGLHLRNINLNQQKKHAVILHSSLCKEIMLNKHDKIRLGEEVDFVEQRHKADTSSTYCAFHVTQSLTIAPLQGESTTFKLLYIPVFVWCPQAESLTT